MPLHAGLTAARIAEQTKVMEVLRDLSLASAGHWRGDLAALDADEHAELVTTLQRGGVALGDRSRLRVWAESKEAGGDHMLWIDPEQRLSSTLPRRVQESEGKAAAEDNGVSSDTIAIMLTALTAVAGYILQARQAATAENTQAAQNRESERIQNAADVLRQQRQVQTQRTQEWLELSQKTTVAFMRLINLVLQDFPMEIYDTVLVSAPADPAFAKGQQFFQMMMIQGQKDKLTPEMIETFVSGKNGLIFDDGVTVGAYDRYYGRNLEGHYAVWSSLSQILQLTYVSAATHLFTD